MRVDRGHRNDLVEHAGVIELDDPAALESGVVGAKAARLAAAKAAGLPVLPGIVLGVRASIEPLRRASQIAAVSGTAAARLALSEEPVDPDLERHVRSTFGSVPIVARSSSPLEASGGWSGAFTSYLDITPAELATAVRGCWASMFARDASERFEALGLSPDDSGMAVLVQELVQPEPGGVATVRGDRVDVIVAERSLSGMLLGWEPGRSAVVESGKLPSGPAVVRYGSALVASVARVAAECAAATADDHFEWACVAGEILVLQCRRLDVTARVQASSRHRGDPALRSEVVARAGRLAARFGGAAGDALVLSWALAPEMLSSRHVPAPAGAPPVSLASIQATAERIASSAWGVEAASVLDVAQQALGALRSRVDDGAVERIARMAPIDWTDGWPLIDSLEAMGSRLVARGVLADATDVWRLGLDDLADHIDEERSWRPAGHTAEALAEELTGHADHLPAEEPAEDIAGESPGTRARPRPVSLDPWEPFLFESTTANGSWGAGAPASDGQGAGRVLVLDQPRRLAGSLQRYVLYVVTPQPGYAPLLWGAAALVAAGGSASAHLFDVARSLGVPAVAGCARPEWDGTKDVVAAVDGSSGDVAWM